MSLRGTKKSPAFSLRAQGRAHTVFALTRRGVLAAAVPSVETGLCLLAALRDSSKGLRITVLCPRAAPGRFMCPVPGGRQAEAHGNRLISLINARSSDLAPAEQAPIGSHRTEVFRTGSPAAAPDLLIVPS